MGSRGRWDVSSHGTIQLRVVIGRESHLGVDPDPVSWMRWRQTSGTVLYNHRPDCDSPSKLEVTLECSRYETILCDAHITSAGVPLTALSTWVACASGSGPDADYTESSYVTFI